MVQHHLLSAMRHFHALAEAMYVFSRGHRLFVVLLVDLYHLYVTFFCFNQNIIKINFRYYSFFRGYSVQTLHAYIEVCAFLITKESAVRLR